MDELYEILQIQQATHWQLIRRFKNFLKIRKIKTNLKSILEDKSNFIDSVQQFCYFMDVSLQGLSITKPSDLSCRVIFYNNVELTFMMTFYCNYDDKHNCITRLIVNKNELDRMQTHLSVDNELTTYNMYIYKDKLPFYNVNTSKGRAEYNKAVIIDNTINYMYNTLTIIIEEIATKYIKPRKEHRNETKSEAIPESECKD